MTNIADRKVKREKWSLLIHLKKTLEVPMNILAFLWLILTIWDLLSGLPIFLNHAVTAIWILFWFHFFLEFSIAPKKTIYLSHNWLTILALIVPAIRILRIVKFLRYIRLVRGTYLIRILGSINRGMRALGRGLGNKGLPYVLGLTLMIILAGAAGIMNLEHGHSEYFKSYMTALWWTSMMVTTMGSDYFPLSTEGRFLALLLAIYGFSVFGYLTATIASIFVDKNINEQKLPIREIEILKLEIKKLSNKIEDQKK